CLPVSVCGTGTIDLARGFSWQCGIGNFATLFHSPSQLGIVERICLLNFLTAWAHTSIGGHSVSSCVPPLAHTTQDVVQEYQPVVHRLRRSASPSVPTNPERTSLPQEILGIR